LVIRPKDTKPQKTPKTTMKTSQTPLPTMSRRRRSKIESKSNVSPPSSTAVSAAAAAPPRSASDSPPSPQKQDLGDHNEKLSEHSSGVFFNLRIGQSLIWVKSERTFSLFTQAYKAPHCLFKVNTFFLEIIQGKPIWFAVIPFCDNLYLNFFIFETTYLIDGNFRERQVGKIVSSCGQSMTAIMFEHWVPTDDLAHQRYQLAPIPIPYLNPPAPAAAAAHVNVGVPKVPQVPQLQQQVPQHVQILRNDARQKPPHIQIRPP
jgi:hypothetical protein